MADDLLPSRRSVEQKLRAEIRPQRAGQSPRLDRGRRKPRKLGFFRRSTTHPSKLVRTTASIGVSQPESAFSTHVFVNSVAHRILPEEGGGTCDARCAFVCTSGLCPFSDNFPAASARQGMAFFPGRLSLAKREVFPARRSASLSKFSRRRVSAGKSRSLRAFPPRLSPRPHPWRDLGFL